MFCFRNIRNSRSETNLTNLLIESDSGMYLENAILKNKNDSLRVDLEVIKYEKEKLEQPFESLNMSRSKNLINKKFSSFTNGWVFNIQNLFQNLITFKKEPKHTKHLKLIQQFIWSWFNGICVF